MNTAELRDQAPTLVEGDGGWDQARQAFNLLIDQRPAAIVMPERVEHVVGAVNFARENGLRVAAQRTGHNAGPLGDLSETLLVRTDRLGGAAIEPDHRHAAVGPAAKWADVTGPASEGGLAPLAGSSPNVGVVGYTLGGGLSWLGRKHGLACNSVRKVQLVNARGEIVHADASENADLFWALRGGGGGLGVVTGMEFDLFEVPQLYAGMLAWPWERGGEVLEAWRQWTESAPDEATSLGRFVQIPPFEEIPELVRGKKLAIVEVAFLGGEEEGAELIAPLRDLGPEIDTFSVVPPAALGMLHMDPPEPVPGQSDHALLGDLPAAAIEALVESAGPASGSPLVSVELRHLGGALGREPEDAGALARLDGSFSLFGVGMVANPEMGKTVGEALARVRKAHSSWETGALFGNFCEIAQDESPFFTREAHERLCGIKAAYDPDDLFRASHPIPPG
jgi:FAD/FMN-containing dehydrogenase